MKNKNILLKIISVLIVVCVICGLIGMPGVLTTKVSSEKYHTLKHNGQNIDILFVGNSQVSADVIPMDLWKKHGYSSHIIYAKNNDVKRYKSMLELSLKYTKPKLIVLSTDKYWVRSSDKTILTSYHDFSDAFPISGEKITSTFELFESAQDRAEILFPMIRFHDMWRSDEKSFVSLERSMRGFEYGSETTKLSLNAENKKGGKRKKNKDGKKNRDDKKKDSEIYSDPSLEHIKAFVEVAKKSEIPVLILTLPMYVNDKEWEYFDVLSECTDEWNTDYLNLTEETEIVNENCDFSDYTHLNISGAKKLTDYFGNYIEKNYIIVRSEDPVAGEQFKDYMEIKNQYINHADPVRELLISCADDDYNVCIGIKHGNPIYKSETDLKIIENLAGNNSLYHLYECAREDEDYYVFFDRDNDVVHEIPYQDISESMIPDNGWHQEIDDDDKEMYISIRNRHTGEFLDVKSLNVELYIDEVDD